METTLDANGGPFVLPHSGRTGASSSTPAPRHIKTAALIPDCGYFVEPFLSRSEMDALQQLHQETTPAVPSDFYVTAFSSDVAVKRHIFESIKAMLADKVEALTPGYRILMASYVTKRANGSKGRLPMHQDYSIVKPDACVSINVWIPLCDVDEHNGCLRMLEGSQHLGHISAMPPNPAPYDSFRQELETSCLTPVPMDGGTACLFDSRLLHATGANETATDRNAVFLSLVPESISPHMYLWNAQEPAALDGYEIDSEFLLNMTPNLYVAVEDITGAKFTGRITYTMAPWSLAELQSRLPAARSMMPVKQPEPVPSIPAPPATDRAGSVSRAPVSSVRRPSLQSMLAALLGFARKGPATVAKEEVLP